MKIAFVFAYINAQRPELAQASQGLQTSASCNCFGLSPKLHTWDPGSTGLILWESGSINNVCRQQGDQSLRAPGPDLFDKQAVKPPKLGPKSQDSPRGGSVRGRHKPGLSFGKAVQKLVYPLGKRFKQWVYPFGKRFTVGLILWDSD